MFLRYRNSSNAFSYISVFIQRDLQTDVERVPSGIGWCFPDPCELTFANTLLLSNAAISLGNAFISLEISCSLLIIFSLFSLIIRIIIVIGLVVIYRSFVNVSTLQELQQCFLLYFSIYSKRSSNRC